MKEGPRGIDPPKRRPDPAGEPDRDQGVDIADLISDSDNHEPIQRSRLGRKVLRTASDPAPKCRGSGR